MDIKRENLSPTRTKLMLELSVEEITPFIKEAVEHLSSHVNIKGFRAGKVPYEVLKQQLGELPIYEEAAKLAINKYLREVLVKENLELAAWPQVNITKLAPQNPIGFEVILDLMPTVKFKEDWRALKIKVPKQEVSQEKIDQFLENLALRYAKVTAKNEPAVLGDKVVLDFTVSFDKVVPEDGVTKNLEIILGQKQMIPGFEEEILGLKKDDQKTFMLEFPLTHYHKQYGGKKGEFNLTVKEVFAVDTPKLDDDFAKIFQYKTFDELLTQVKLRLNEEAQFSNVLQKELEMFDQLIAKCEFSEIPLSLIEAEKQKMLEELKNNVSRQGLKWEDYLQHLKTKEEDIKEGFDKDAYKRIQTSLIVRHIKNSDKITASPEEISRELEKILKEQADPKIKPQLQTAAYKEHLKNMIETQKVLHLLKETILDFDK